MSSKMNFVRGVRPCIVALRDAADDGNTFWDYLNTKSPHQPLCFSVFQAEAEDAITISEGHAFLHFGFTSNHDGTVSRHEFDTPKKITFVINFSNSEVTHKLAASLPCPRSGSMLQNQIITDRSIQHMILSSDKLLRLLVSEEACATGGFKYDILRAISPASKIDVIDFKMIVLYLEEFVTHFFDLNPSANKIVIKKNTTLRSIECLVLDRCGVAALPEKLEELQIFPSDNVLVEEFTSECPSDEQRIRVYSTRNGKKMGAAKGKLQPLIPTTLSPLFCELLNAPCSTENTSALQVATVINDTLRHKMHTVTQRYWDTILPHLKKIDEDAEPMVFGFDFVLSSEGPVCTQVSSLNSLSPYLQYVSGNYGYESLYGMFNHILNRSYDYLLHERTVVIIGMASYSKLHILEYLARVGAHTVLLDDKPPPLWASGFVQHFIQAPLYDPACCEEAAKKAVWKLKELGVKPFSVVTLSDDFVPFRAALTAVLWQEQLLKSKNRSISLKNALRNKDKICVYCNIQKQESSNNPERYSIAPNVIRLTDKNVSTIQIECPHILKLSTSACAFGCMRIDTTKDIAPAYQAAKDLIAATSTKAGAGTCFDVRIFMSELYEGSEHDLDVIMRDGAPVFHIFSDNSPVDAEKDTSGKEFLEKGCVMPSKIINGTDAQPILSSIVGALNSLDLSHGVYSVEFIVTRQGIKVIDVNQRPGGYYINEWVNTITGVDTFAAEVVLRSELEYFVQPLASSRSIAGYNVFSEEQLAEELARYASTTKDVRMFSIQGQERSASKGIANLYATIYEVFDSAF